MKKLRTINTLQLENGSLQLTLKEATFDKNMQRTRRTQKKFFLTPTTCGIVWAMREAGIPALVYRKNHDLFMTTNYKGFKNPYIYKINNYSSCISCTRVFDENIESSCYPEALQLIGKNELFTFSNT